MFKENQGIKNLEEIKSEMSKQNSENQNKPKWNSESQRNFGFWKSYQQIKYVVFIDFFKQDLQSRQRRKINKIFKTMSEFLQTRDPIQCRSHHMKQLRTFRKIRNIIQEIKKNNGEEEYRQVYEKIISNSSIFKRVQPQSTRYKTQKKIQPKTRQIGVQTIQDNPTKIQPEAPQQIPAFVPVSCFQGNFMMPFWNIAQSGVTYSLNN